MRDTGRHLADGCQLLGAQRLAPAFLQALDDRPNLIGNFVQDDFDFLYGRSFEDPDGHMWGVSWMDAEAAAKAMAAPVTA